MENQLKPYWLRIHKALHSNVEHYNDKPIGKAPNGCRYFSTYDTDLGDVTFMVQNPNKSSEYAKRARNGETITWIIPKKGSWILIDKPVKDLSCQQ